MGTDIYAYLIMTMTRHRARDLGRFGSLTTALGGRAVTSPLAIWLPDPVPRAPEGEDDRGDGDPCRPVAGWVRLLFGFG